MGQAQARGASLHARHPDSASRRLSAFETLVAKTTPYASIAQWFQVVGPASVDELAEAVKKAHRRFAALQATLEGRLLILRPELEPDVALDVTAEVSTQALARLAGREASVGLGATREQCEGRLLWRATILREGWVMVVLHHAIADGRSMGLLMRAVLEDLAGMAVTPPTQLVLAPKLEKLMGRRAGGRLAGRAVNRLYKLHRVPRTASSLMEGPEWPTPEGMAKWQFRRTQACATTLDISGKLRAACRRHGVTVNAALIAGLASALRCRMTKKGEVLMQPVVTVDARRHFPGSEELFGSYSIGGFGGKVSVDEHPKFWDLAQQAKTVLQCVTERAETQKISWYMRFCASAMGKQGTAWLATALGLNGKAQGRVNAFLISNTGPLSNLAAGPFHVAQSFFVTNLSAFGPFVWLNAATIGEKLFLSLCYVEPLLSEASATGIIDDLAANLVEAARDEDCQHLPSGDDATPASAPARLIGGGPATLE